MAKKLLLLYLILITSISYCQIENEVLPPFNFKTISFLQNGQNNIPIFRLGEPFQFVFDDLYGNEANYFYTLTHCDYDWKPSQLAKAEYLNGFDDQRIQD